MHGLTKSIIGGLLCCFLQTAWAQTEEEEHISVAERRRYEHPDTSKTLDNWRTRVRTAEKLDLLVQRTFPILTDRNDSVPINPSSSGSFQFFVMRNFILSRKGHVLQVAPGLSFYRTQFYGGSAQKTFPSTRDTTSYERIGIDKLALSVGMGIMLKREYLPRDTINYKTISMLEFGFMGSFGMGSFYKVQDNAIANRATLRIPGLNDINRWQLAGYLRITYKVFVLSAVYHISPMFLRNRTFSGFSKQDVVTDGGSYPAMPPLEVGIGILLF